MDIGPRYDQETSVLDWGLIYSWKRRIGDNVYFFIAVSQPDSLVVQASREIRTFENVHGLYYQRTAKINGA
jgi:hypothetical protein